MRQHIRAVRHLIRRKAAWIRCRLLRHEWDRFAEVSPECVPQVWEGCHDGHGFYRVNVMGQL